MFHQGANTMRICMHHMFIIIFHRDYCNLTRSAWDARTRKCWPLVFSSGFKRWKSIICDDFAGFSRYAVSTAGRGMSWSWWIIKNQVLDEEIWESTRWRMNECNQNGGPASSCWCYPFQCSERMVRASADPNLSQKKMRICGCRPCWPMSSCIMTNIASFEICSDLVTNWPIVVHKSVHKSVCSRCSFSSG